VGQLGGEWMEGTLVVKKRNGNGNRGRQALWGRVARHVKGRPTSGPSWVMG